MELYYGTFIRSICAKRSIHQCITARLPPSAACVTRISRELVNLISYIHQSCCCSNMLSPYKHQVNGDDYSAHAVYSTRITRIYTYYCRVRERRTAPRVRRKSNHAIRSWFICRPRNVRVLIIQTVAMSIFDCAPPGTLSLSGCDRIPRAVRTSADIEAIAA